ncbi:MAG: hypothetical protein M2R45_01981 [Verrucomicrobia subdivision 3 bacterium]|nr:hypothetical protein [Limisphaerales bacterium]
MLFLYLAHIYIYAVRADFASESFRGKSKAGLYGEVIEGLDWSAGEIVEALERDGLSERALFIFTSGTGQWTMFKEFGGTAKPLRGEKGKGWRGWSSGNLPLVRQDTIWGFISVRGQSRPLCNGRFRNGK